MWCAVGAFAIAPPPACMDLGAAAPSRTIKPSCGNGVVDPGEVCDDGNRVGGDGCNAWCNAFDHMAAACTMSGSVQACSHAGIQLGVPSQSVFCDLTSVDARVRNGVTSLFMADGGVLLQHDLMVSPTAAIKAFASTPVTGSPYSRFCSVTALADSDVVVAHECVSHKVVWFSSPGQASGVQVIANLGAVLVATEKLLVRDYFDATTNMLLIAGTPTGSDAVGMCMALYAVSLLSPYTLKTVAYMPCVINVPNDLTLDGVSGVFTTYDADGMKPSMVFREECVHDTTACYVVYMNRGDLHTVKAYVPVIATNAAASTLTQGVKYVVRTNTMDNVLLSTTHKRYSATFGSVLTLTGSCLSVQPPGDAPPITFGDVCTLVSTNGWGCAVPLRNPFTTDVLVSPFLMPRQFSSSLTHNQLRGIFSDENLGLANASGMAGSFLYQQLLTNTLMSTLPIDFVQMPGTGDIIYITSTSINVISTKGITLQDYANYPYCLPHDAVLCKSGWYGSVGGGCLPCPATRSPVPTPAEQMMCVGQSGNGRRLLSDSQMPPSVSFSATVGGDVSQAEIDLSLCYYMTLNCVACPAHTTQVSSRSPINDNADAALASNPQTPLTGSLQENLMHTYAAAVGLTLPSDGSEYSLTLAHPDLRLIDGKLRDPSCIPTPLTQYYALDELNMSASDFRVAASRCDHLMYLGAIRRVIRCLIKQIRNVTISQASSQRQRSRRLMQTATLPAAMPRFGQQNDVGVMSTNHVIFGGSGYSASGNNTTSTSDDSSSSVLMIAIIAGVGGALVLVGIAIFVSLRSSKKKPAPTKMQ